MVGAATEKPLEPKQVRTRGTHSKLVSDERNVRVGCNVQEQSSDRQAEWCGWSCR